jgi:hypothetical protein
VVDVRPRDPSEPAVVGTLYLDRGSAELVRARLSFTPVTYRDNTVEDLTILLDYALIDGRAWLPYRQTIEIRRNAGWLDLPYTGVIRGTWEFGDYDLDLVVPPATFAGPAIGGLQQAGDSAGPWPEPFDSVLARAGPVVSEQEVAAARVEVARAVEGHLAGGLAPARVSANSASDLVHFDRVQGVALGVGGAIDRGPWELRPRIGAGTADGRVTGGLTLRRSTRRPRPSTLELYATRGTRDLSDLPVISRALNSLAAQEWGEDHGDYALVEGTGARLEVPLTGDTRLATRVGWEDPSPLGISATAARGTFRPQADLGGPGYWAGSLGVTKGGAGEEGWALQVDGGAGRTDWGRATLMLQGGIRVGSSEIRVRGYGGAATLRTPTWRTFVLGGRGTLLGDRYRGWGGRRMGWGALEWRIPLPFPALPLGDFASTGHTATVAPFLAGGWAGERVPGMPWAPTGPTRASAGVALELIYQLVRIEAGRSFQTGKLAVTFDVSRSWWGVL